MSASAPIIEKTNLRPTWAEVSLANLRHNFRLLQDYVHPAATVCAVVKAHAYGHGSIECARALEQEGAKWFGVTSTDEGIALREAGIRGRILLMTGFWRGDEETVLERDLTPAVWHWEQVDRLEYAAAKMQRKVAVHLKVDTGMARLGVDPDELPLLAQVLKKAEHLVVEGVCSHLSSSEVLDSPTVGAQMKAFDAAVTSVIQGGLSPAYFHIANSAAVLARRATWMNFVRPGIALYGYYLPFTNQDGSRPEDTYDMPVKPVLSWKTRIFALREVEAGQAIGYSGAHVTAGPARIAALPVGYADGLSRKLSSRGRVLVRGQFAPMVGNVSMDITLVDVTNISGADLGDEVVILGTSGEHSITAAEHALLAETIPYEILCAISKRVPRRYI